MHGKANASESLNLKWIKESEMADLQHVFEEAPDYVRRIKGCLPGPEEAQSTCETLPPGKGYNDKFVFGIYLGSSSLIGCADLIRGYPDNKTAVLGLLLISEKYQKHGYGKQAYEETEKVVLGWPEIEKIRIGIIGTNSKVIPFWGKMGFVDIGLRKPYRHDKVVSECLVFEKAVRF